MSVEQGRNISEVPSRKPNLVDRVQNLFRRQGHQLQTAGAGAFPTPTSTFDQDQFGPDISRVQAPPFPQQPVRRGGESLPKGTRPEHPLITRRNFLKAGGATAIALGLTAFGLNNLPRSGGAIATPTESPRHTDSPTPTVKATPTPSEAPTAGPTPTASAIETPAPTPSPAVTESPTPTLSPTESPVATATPTTKPTEKPTPSPEVTTLNEHLRRRRDWLNGTTKIPDDWRIVMPSVPGQKNVQYGRFNILSDSIITSDPHWTPFVQTVVVDTYSADGRLWAVMGVEDASKEKGRGLMLMNFGLLKDGQLAVHSTTNGALQTMTGSQDITIFEMEKVLNEQLGKPVLVVFYPFGPDYTQSTNFDRQGMAEQASLTKKLIYSLLDSTKSPSKGMSFISKKYPKTFAIDYKKSFANDIKFAPFGFSLRTWPTGK